MVITKKYIKILIALLALLLAAGAVYHAFSARQTAANGRYRIILDAGHGG